MAPPNACPSLRRDIAVGGRAVLSHGFYLFCADRFSADGLSPIAYRRIGISQQSTTYYIHPAPSIDAIYVLYCIYFISHRALFVSHHILLHYRIASIHKALHLRSADLRSADESKTVGSGPRSDGPDLVVYPHFVPYIYQMFARWVIADAISVIGPSVVPIMYKVPPRWICR